MRHWKRNLIAGLATTVCPFASASETGINRIYAEYIKGDYVTAGASSRVRDGFPQTDPFNVDLAGIPIGATVVKAFANWSYMADEATATDTIKIDGTNVTGALTGTGDVDLVWGYEKAVAYSADVTALVTVNGAYSIEGAIDDPDGEWIGEGLSFVVVYEDPNATMKAVHVYDGYFSTTTGSGQASIDFIAEYSGGNAHFFTNALDGQDIFSDDFVVNGTTASGDFGLGGAGNAFRGTLGPGPADYNYYDHAEGDAAAYMGVGNVSLLYRTEGFTNGTTNYTDAIGHSFSAMSFAAVPEPGTCVAAVIGLAWASRRKTRLNSSKKVQK